MIKRSRTPQSGGTRTSGPAGGIARFLDSAVVIKRLLISTLASNAIALLACAVVCTIACAPADAALPAVNHSDDYILVMSYGQTPYQLGYCTNTSTGWDWWDGSGENRQKNIIVADVFRMEIIDGKPNPKHVSGLSLMLNVTYPIYNHTTGFSVNHSTIALNEDSVHRHYCGTFYYPDDAYTGVYDVNFTNTIDSIEISFDTNFTTTLWGCQASGCHDAWSTQSEPSERVPTTTIHPNRIISGSFASDCQSMCHSGYASQFLTATPVHLHEILFGHEGGFICGKTGAVTIFEIEDGGECVSILTMATSNTSGSGAGSGYPGSDLVRPRSQTALNASSHVSIADCTDCHTSFIHDGEGSATHDLAEPHNLSGTNIASTGVHSSVACELCHGNLSYPAIPPDQHSLDGALGSYAPAFTSYQRSEDSYVIDVRDGDLNVTVIGDDPTYNLTLSLIGPIDSAEGIQDLNGSDSWFGTYYVPSVGGSAVFANEFAGGSAGGSGSRIYRPQNATLAQYRLFDDDSQSGTWVARVLGWSEGVLNYTITSNHPIAHKPIIHIPWNCSECHNPDPRPDCDGARTEIPIPNWDERGIAYAHANMGGGSGGYDVPCRSCHNALHEVAILNCTDCHTLISGGHRGIPAPLRRNCTICHFEPHYNPRRMGQPTITKQIDRSFDISTGEICGFDDAIPENTEWITFNSTWTGNKLELAIVRPRAVSAGVNISEYATNYGRSDWNLNLTDEMKNLIFNESMVLRDDNTSHKFIYMDNPEHGKWYSYAIGVDLSSDAYLSINYEYHIDWSDCTDCHNDPYFIVSDFKRGIHAGVNDSESNIHRACWACHEDKLGNHSFVTKNCSNNSCHTLNQSKYREPMIYEHFKDADRLDNPGNLTTSNVSTTVGCDACHINSIVDTSDPFTGRTYKVSHYGLTDELMAYPDHIRTNCTDCHEDKANREKWGDAIDPMDWESDLIVEDEEATMHAGDLWELRNGYIFKVVSVDLNGNNAVVELRRKGEVLAERVVSGNIPFEYKKTITEDGRTYNQTIVLLNLTGIMRGADSVVATFAGRTIRRIHPETANAACYACHVEGYMRNDRYTIVARRGNVTYYAEVLLDFERENNQSRTFASGEDWNLGDGFVLTVKAIDRIGDLAILELTRNGVVVLEDVVNTSETFEYEADIHPLTDVTIFRANVSGVFRSYGDDLVVLRDVRLISPDIHDADINSNSNSGESDEDSDRVDGYNVSWLAVGEDFGGKEPDTFHVPPLVNGGDIAFADCVQCHDIGTGMEIKRVDAISSRLGAHASLNAYAENETALSDSIDRACWACHGIGLEPDVHPDKKPKECADCHVHEILFDAVDLSDVPHGQVRNCTACHGGSKSDPHVITSFGALPYVGDISLSPQPCYVGETVVLNAVAASGWKLKVKRAEYFIDSLGAGGTGVPLEPIDGAFDSNTELITAEIDTTKLSVGNHTIYIHAMESVDTWGRVASVTLEIAQGRRPIISSGAVTSAISTYWYVIVVVVLILLGIVVKMLFLSRKGS